MNKQKTQEQQIDFSVIDERNNLRNNFDFSLESLISQQQQKSTSKNINTGKTGIQILDSIGERKDIQINGSFLRDLGKLQQQISFDSQSFNAYAEDLDVTPYPQPKLLSTYQPTITKNNSKHPTQSYNHLILDFKHVPKNLGIKSPQKKLPSQSSKSKSNQLSNSKSNSKEKQVLQFKKIVKDKPKPRQKIKIDQMANSQRITRQQTSPCLENNKKFSDYFGYSSCTLIFTKKQPKINVPKNIKASQQTQITSNQKQKKVSIIQKKSLRVSLKSKQKNKQQGKEKSPTSKYPRNVIIQI